MYEVWHFIWRFGTVVWLALAIAWTLNVWALWVFFRSKPRQALWGWFFATKILTLTPFLVARTLIFLYVIPEPRHLDTGTLFAAPTLFLTMGMAAAIHLFLHKGANARARRIGVAAKSSLMS
jgi:hypothetical protein